MTLFITSLVIVAGGVLLAWAIDREAKRRAHRAAVQRWMQGPGYQKLQADFEAWATAIGTAIAPAMDELVDAIQQMAPALEEIGRAFADDAEQEQEP